MNMTERSPRRSLESLFAIAPEERDLEWQSALAFSVIDETCASDGKPVRGPDGFLYQQWSCLSAAREDQPKRVRMQDELSSLLELGVGVVLFSQAEPAEWVFTHGDLLNVRLTGSFYSQLPPRIRIADTDGTDGKVVESRPSEEFLPISTRLLLRAWLESREAHGVRIQILDYPQDGMLLRHLVFDFSRSGKGDEDLPELLRGASWFLPRHYMVLGSNDPHEDRETFVDL